MVSEYEIFKVGDWVTWRFKPADPDGPYRDRWMYRRNQNRNNQERDPIEDRLLRYRKPPYLVVQVFPAVGSAENSGRGAADAELNDPMESVGHPQFVRIAMYLEPKWGGPEKKIRTFSGKLFVKTHSPRKSN